MASTKLNADMATKLLGNSVVMGVCLTTGIVGGVLVLFVYSSLTRKTEERFFIPYLAVMDLLACATGSSFSIALNRHFFDFPWESVCKTLFYITWSTSFSSSLILFVIVVNRYLKVCKPNGRRLTSRGRKVSLLIVIILPFIFTIPALFFLGIRSESIQIDGENISISVCSVLSFEKDEFMINLEAWKKIYFLLINIAITAIMISTVVLYIPVGKEIYKRFVSIRRTIKVEKRTTKQKQKVARNEKNFTYLTRKSDLDHVTSKSTDRTNSTGSSTPRVTFLLPPKIGHTESFVNSKNSKRRTVRQNFSKMFMTVVFFYILFYIPTKVFLLISETHRPMFWQDLPYWRLFIFMTLKRMFLFYHAANPIIYGYFDSTFRLGIVSLFRSCKMIFCSLRKE